VFLGGELFQEGLCVGGLEVGEFKARRNGRAHQGESAVRIEEASLPTAGGDRDLHPLAVQNVPAQGNDLAGAARMQLQHRYRVA